MTPGAKGESGIGLRYALTRSRWSQLLTRKHGHAPSVRTVEERDLAADQRERDALDGQPQGLLNHSHLVTRRHPAQCRVD